MKSELYACVVVAFSAAVDCAAYQEGKLFVFAVFVTGIWLWFCNIEE